MFEIFHYSIRFDATRIRMGFATIPSDSKQQKHWSNGCLKTGVRKIHELTLCAYVHVQLPCMALQIFIAKNLEIKTKSAYALLNKCKTGKLKIEPLSCLSPVFVQNSIRSITSLVSITDSDTTGADFELPEGCFTLQNNCATRVAHVLKTY